MKTPKRYHTTPKESWSEDYIEYRHDIELSRWKRKNREAQYKRTITRQAEEIHHLRTALAIRTINDINENNIESLKFIQQHLTVETFQPHIERDGDRNWMFTWKRPIPRWDNSIIDLHLPEDEQP